MNQLSDDKKNIKTENYTSIPDITEPSEQSNVHGIKDAMLKLDEKRPRYIPFWSENPNVLFQQKYLFEFFPVDEMTYNQKLNTVSRTIIVLVLLSFIFTRNFRLLIIGAITLGAIFLMHFYHEKEENKVDSKKVIESVTEGFAGPGRAVYSELNMPVPNDLFTVPNSTNPFSNVLITDYDYNPNKKPAPPAFNPNVNSEILTQAKLFVNEANPDHPDIADKLFKDLGEQLEFEQSLRPFHSNPGTTIPNDQGAFADFCYGSMISAKEGNKFAAARNMSHYTLY